MRLFILLFVILSFGCKKESGIFEETCNLQGEDIIQVKNKTGTLTYTDSIYGLKMPEGHYFIKNSNVEGLYLPFQVCNAIKNQFFSLKLGNSVKVTFSGRIERLPETTDAFSLMIELESISLSE